jgi:hypothetical protein
MVFSCLCAVLNVLMFAQLPGGWLEVSTPEGPATGHLGTGFSSWFPCV